MGHKVNIHLLLLFFLKICFFSLFFVFFIWFLNDKCSLDANVATFCICYNWTNILNVLYIFDVQHFQLVTYKTTYGCVFWCILVFFILIFFPLSTFCSCCRIQFNSVYFFFFLSWVAFVKQVLFYASNKKHKN